MALYRILMWRHALTHDNVALLRSPQRAITVKVVHGHRTIWFETACLRAGKSSWDLEVEALVADFTWRCDLHSSDELRLAATKVRPR